MDFPSFIWGSAIGAGAIIASGFFRKAGEDFYSWAKKKIHPNSSESKESRVVVHVEAGLKEAKTEHSSLAENRYPGIERVSTISLEEIIQSVSSAPPLQRMSVADRFLGLRVEWDTHFLNGTPRQDNTISLHLTVTNSKSLSKSVVCKVSLDEYRELGILPEGAKIRVLGEIEEVETWGVMLKNARLHIYDLHRDA